MPGKPLLAFYDSGIGGLPYVSMCRTVMEGARFVYFADSAHFPLGISPADEVRRVVLGAARAIVDAYAPETLVLACNTASVVALSAVREAFPGLPVVGTVPAVKPAAERGHGGIAILGSERTVSGPYTLDLVRRFAPDKSVSLVAAPEWIEFVELRWLDSTPEERREAVRPLLTSLLGKGVGTFVMACTHFLYLEDDIRAVAGREALIIDSAEGVAKRARDMAHRALKAPGRRDADAGAWGGDVFHTSSAAPRLSAFASRFGFMEGGILLS